jgi:hypothetical protein
MNADCGFVAYNIRDRFKEFCADRATNAAHDGLIPPSAVLADGKVGMVAAAEAQGGVAR